jgi:hypothetical protein
MLLSDDSVILQLILNGIGHIAVRRCHVVFKTSMLGGIELEGELIATLKLAINVDTYRLLWRRIK